MLGSHATGSRRANSPSKRTMEPLKPMKPMSPMPTPQRWWSEEFGDPSASGAQAGTRYAFFLDKKLLLIERGGKVQRFDTGEHRIEDVSQASTGEALTFTSQRGPVSLNEFRKLS
jgi:hypothetical protein